MATNRKSDNERLKELEERKQQIENQMKSIRARVSEKERKARTKRLIEIGAEVEAALNCTLETKDARLAFGNFLRALQEKDGQITKAIFPVPDGSTPSEPAPSESHSEA